MPSLVLIVFSIQLFIHIINSIGAGTINSLLWNLYNKLPHGASQDFKDQVRLRREVVRLKREMAAISAQDNFSKWAKLRREHDKALAEHDKKASAVSSAKSSFDVTANTSRWVVTNGLRLFLQFWHAKTPMFSIPRGWVPWYVEWTLAFPRAPSGAVSIQIWGAACATVISLVGDLIEYALLNLQGQQARSAKGKEEPLKFGAAATSGEEKTT